MQRLKWVRNYDGLDGEDCNENSDYKRFLTHVKTTGDVQFCANVEGEDRFCVTATVWRTGGLGEVEKEFRTFASAKAWAKRVLEERVKRGF